MDRDLVEVRITIGWEMLMSRNQAAVFQKEHTIAEVQDRAAVRTDEQILIHTPHLEDKYMGTRMIIDMLKNDLRVQPGRVLIDHVEEPWIKATILVPDAFLGGVLLAEAAQTKGLELAWAADPYEAFFLEIQGSGRLRLPNGDALRLKVRNAQQSLTKLAVNQ